MLSDEEREALRIFKSEYETCDHYSSDLIIELDDAEIILNLIEKQSKEIERLKIALDLKCNKLQCKNMPDNIEMILMYKNDFDRNFGNDYISKDKIKAKIEEYKKQQKEEPDAYLCIKVLSSLLDKE